MTAEKVDNDKKPESEKYHMILQLWYWVKLDLICSQALMSIKIQVKNDFNAWKLLT